jgi:hypothetical protein
VAGEETMARSSIASMLVPLREVGACSLAGMVVGVLVGGLGGRLAMRVSGIAAGPSLQGVRTDAGFPVGAITAQGTLELIVFAGLLSGAIGGMFYAAVSPWLTRLGAWRGLAFGVLLLAVLGSLVLDPDNPDFGRFGPSGVNVGMFGALFLIFGALVAPVASRLKRSGANASAGARRAVEALIWLALLPPLLFVAAAFAQILGALTGGGESDVPAGQWFFVAVLALAVALRWLPLRRGARLERPFDVPARRAALLSYAALAIPVIGATWLTLTGIVRIFESAL